MENKTVIVNKDSFGYKFLSQNYDDERDMPSSECSYFWSLIFAFILYPFWKPITLFDNHNSITLNTFYGIVLYIVLFIFGGGIYGIIDILLLGGEFNDENIFHAFSMVVILCSLIVFIIGLLCFLNYAKDKIKYKFKTGKISLSNDEIGFSLFENIKNLKRKVCRPIEYRESDKNV